VFAKRNPTLSAGLVSFDEEVGSEGNQPSRRRCSLANFLSQVSSVSHAVLRSSFLCLTSVAVIIIGGLVFDLSFR